MKERLENPYFELFKGAKVLRSSIERECPPMLLAVDILAKEGQLIGQHVMSEPGEKPDILLWIRGMDKEGR